MHVTAPWKARESGRGELIEDLFHCYWLGLQRNCVHSSWGLLDNSFDFPIRISHRPYVFSLSNAIDAF